MSKRLFNPLWLHFTEPEPGKAKCTHCNRIVSRGAAGTKGMNTTNIWRHLENHHKEAFQDAKKKKEEMKKLGSNREPILVQLPELPQLNKWKNSNPTSKKLDKLIIEMCATDDLPFAVVSGSGFKRLMAELEPKYNIKSEEFYRSVQFEELYKTVQTAIRMLVTSLCNEPCLSFTVDCSPGATESLMSLTGHFVDEWWERRQVVLHVKAVTEASTMDYIRQFFLPMLKYWSIDRRRVFLMLRDKGAAISEEEKFIEVPGLRCSAHILQSAVEEGISSQQDVGDIIAKVRTCFGHFQDSILAKQQLRVIQDEFNMAQNVYQDDVTQWISTLQMLRCAQEQRRVLSSYAQKYGNVSVPSSQEWDLIKDIIETLSPVEEVAKELCNMASLISCMIPSVSVLKMFLQTKSTATERTMTLRQTMLRVLEQRYGELEDIKVLVLATLLDPRYKCNVLSPKSVSVAPKWLKEEHAVWLAQVKEEGEAEVKPDAENVALEDEGKPTGGDLVEQMFATILGSQPLVMEHRSPELSGQLEQYLNEPLLDRKHRDPLVWWRGNTARFSLLAPLARKLLSAPPTSVPTERLFTEREDSGNQTTGENAEKLYFLKHNLPLIKYEY